MSLKFKRDNKGAIPFALVAVLILILAGISIAYINRLNYQQHEAGLKQAQIVRLSNEINLLHTDLELKANIFGLNSIFVATQLEKNDTKINYYFSESFEKYISELQAKNSSPSGNYQLSIDDYSAGIYLAQFSTYDILPSDQTRDLKFKTNCTLSSKAPDLSLGGKLGITNLTPYYTLEGWVNYTGKDPDTNLELKKSLTLHKEIDCPYPFLADKFKSLQANAVSGGSNLGRIIKYILTTLAQYRVFQGYGSLKNLPGLAPAPGSISDIITPKDVELATNLAILLETISLYRAYDPEVVKSFNSAYPPQLPERTIQKLIENYASEGIIDPADLVALYICLDEKTIDVATIFAQSIYGIMDQWALKYLEYLGISENLQVARGFVKKVLIVLGAELENDEEIVVGATNLSLPPATYRNESNDSKANVTELTWFNSTGSWEAISNEWRCYGSDDENILSSSLNLSLEASGYQVYPPPNYTLSNSTFFVKARNLTCLKFEHKLELGNSTDEEARIVIRNSSSGAWKALKTYNSSTTSLGLELENLTIPKECDGNIQIGWEFISNNSSSEWLVKNISIYEIFDGVEVVDARPATDYEVENYSCNLVSVLYKAINLMPIGFLEQLYAQATDIIKDMFKALAEYVASAIVDLLFGGSENYPKLELDPCDNVSIIEDTRTALESWVREGIEKLKANITTSAKFILETTKRFIRDIIGKLEGVINSTLNDILTSASDWLETQISNIEGAINSAVDFCIGGIFYLFGQGELYTTAKEYVLAEGKDFWDSFKAEIRGAINKVLDTVGAVFEDITNLAFDALEPILTEVSGMFRTIIIDFLDKLSEFLSLVITWVLTGEELTNTKFLLPVCAQNQFEFWNGCYASALKSKTIKYETFVINQTPDYLELENQSVTDELDLETASCIYETSYSKASQYKLWLSISAPQGVHYTSAKGFSKTPFETTWNIKLYGKLQLSVHAERRALLYNCAHEFVWKNDSLELNLSLPITVYSGWGLEGVSYKPSDVLLLDIVKFITQHWEDIKNAVKIGIDILTKISELFRNIISPLVNFVFWVLDLISNLLQLVIQWLRGFISEVFKAIIDKVMGWLEVLEVEELNFRLGGLDFRVYIDPDKSKNFYSSSQIDELFSVATNLSIFGSELELRLDAIECNQVHDLILTGNLKPLGIDTELVLDPLMLVRSHLVELHAEQVNNNGNGWGFELYLPEIELTNKVSYALPVTPIPIPIPELGVQASVELGTELKYEAPVVDKLVINEFELSSQSGEQWFELCNPTFEDVSIDNWTVSTLTGERKTHKLNGTVSGAIASERGYLIINLSQNFSSNAANGLALYDGNGNIVDKTPIKQDIYYDERSWQRAYDCGLSWIFHPASKGGGNPDINAPAEPYLNLGSLILGSVIDSFSETDQELSDEYERSLEYIIKFAKTFLSKLRERFLEIIREVIVELVFYVDIIIEVIGTGVGGGLRLSFVLEGEAISELLSWLSKTIVNFIKQLTNPNLPTSYTVLPKSIPENLFVRLEIYGKAEALPEVLNDLLPTPELGVEISLRIEANIPAFTAPLGLDQGAWKVEFGVLITYEFGFSALGLGKERLVELWLIKGSLCEISDNNA